MNGLDSMLKMRGGLDAASFPTYLHRKVIWADLNSASALGEDPILPSISRPDTHELFGESIYLAGRELDFLPLEKDVHNVFNDLRHLSHILLTNSDRQLQSLNTLGHADWIYCVKRSLVLLSNKPVIEATDFVPCLALAAHLLLEVCLRNININSRIIDRLVTRSKHALDRVFLNSSTTSTQPTTSVLLLWTLFVAGTAAYSRPEAPWFIERMKEVLDRLRLYTWPDIEDVLEDVWWHSAWKLPYVGFWNEIQISRGMSVT